MYKNKKFFSLMLFFIALGACSFQNILDSHLNDNDLKVQESIYNALKNKDFEFIRNLASEQIINDDFNANLNMLADLLPQGSHTDKSIVGLLVNEMGMHKRINITAQYTYENQYILTLISMTKTGEDYTLMGIKVEPMEHSLEHLNQFTFSNKGVMHYLVFFCLILFPFFTFWTFVKCWKMKTIKRRKLWLLFILIGVGTLQLNWATGQVFIQMLSIQLLSASFFTADPYSPWIFGISLPLGAIMFWMFKEQMTLKEVEQKDQSVSGSKPKTHTEAELASFEKTWKIKLPAAYRNYLLKVGGSCIPPSKIDLLEDWEYNPEKLPLDHLSSDFPHSEAWNDKSLFDVAKGYDSSYYDRVHRTGSIPIKSTGCEGFDILVITGPERGNVWHDDRACNGEGIYPLEDKDGNRISIQAYLK